MFTPTNQDLLFKVTAIVQPMETDFPEYSALGFSRMTILQPASSVSATVEQLDAFICHLKAYKDRMTVNLQTEATKSVD